MCACWVYGDCVDLVAGGEVCCQRAEMGVAGAVVEVEDRDQGGAFVAAQDESVADQIECHIVSISSRIGKGC